MKLQDAPRKAVEERNATACGRIADVLRFRYGMNLRPDRCGGRERGCSPALWESLMYEADRGYD